jgi:hypothetical protein
VTPNPRVLVLAIAAIITGGAAPALAQAIGSPRPFNGLFGSGNFNANARQKVDLTVSLAAASDSDVAAEAPAIVNQVIGPQPTAHADMLVGAADYEWRGHYVDVRANGGSTLRHDRRSGRISSLSHNALAGLTARLPRQISLVVSQTAAYSPSYLSYLYTLFLRPAATGSGEPLPVSPDVPAYDFDPDADGTPAPPAEPDADDTEPPGAPDTPADDFESGADDTQAPPAAPDSPNDFESYAYGTQMTLSRGLTRRSHVWAIAERIWTDYRIATGGQPELEWHGVTGVVSYGLGRNTTASGRYRYRAGNFPYSGVAVTDGTSTEHGVELGLSHSWRFSATRRLTFDVGLGSSRVILPDRMMPLEPVMPPDPGMPPDPEMPSDPETPSDPVMSSDAEMPLEPEMPREPSAGVTLHRRSDPLVGQLGVGYQFGRTWQASAMYYRRVDYVPGLTAPVSADGAAVRIDGLIARRVDALVSAVYSSGRSALNPNSPRFGTYAGDARLRVALTRAAAAYVEYVYFFYDFRGNTQLAPGLPDTLERQGLRVGLTLRVPALGR